MYAGFALLDYSLLSLSEVSKENTVKDIKQLLDGNVSLFLENALRPNKMMLKRDAHSFVVSVFKLLEILLVDFETFSKLTAY